MRVSPDSILPPWTSSRQASPCTTGTQPVPSSPRTRATPRRRAARGTTPLPRVAPNALQGDTPTAATPAASSPSTTSPFNLHTDERVSPKPRQENFGSPVPFDTACSRAWKWPNEPAPWQTTTRLPLCATLSQQSRKFLVCGVSKVAL